ncbi:MAG TPA: hypothetical protein VEY69_17015, partial [Lautropia sp.]|nr:hypothetical protein [Lautropia sp.]
MSAADWRKAMNAGAGRQAWQRSSATARSGASDVTAGRAVGAAGAAFGGVGVAPGTPAGMVPHTHHPS